VLLSLYHRKRADVRLCLFLQRVKGKDLDLREGGSDAD